MKIYTKYIEQLQDFKPRLINPLNKASNDNYRFGDDEELEYLRKFIIPEFKLAGTRKSRSALKKLKALNTRFVNFDKEYPKLYEQAKEGVSDLRGVSKLLPTLPGEQYPEFRLNAEFLETLHASVMIRQKSLLILIDETEDLLAGLGGK